MSPFLDPNDPRYSDTPNVDTHPLEGRGKPSEPSEPLHAALLHGIQYDEIDPGIVTRTAAALRADGYLLVSEAELAEALGTVGEWAYWEDRIAQSPEDVSDLAAAIFAALVKQQEDRER